MQYIVYCNTIHIIHTTHTERTHTRVVRCPYRNVPIGTHHGVRTHSYTHLLTHTQLLLHPISIPDINTHISTCTNAIYEASTFYKLRHNISYRRCFYFVH